MVGCWLLATVRGSDSATMVTYNYHGLQEYRYQEIMNASPLRLIIITYDVAITACAQRDLSKTTRALAVLRNALNFDYAEIAGRLFSLYEWCADLARKGQYDEAARILRELRDAWAACLPTAVSSQRSAAGLPTASQPAVLIAER